VEFIRVRSFEQLEQCFRIRKEVFVEEQGVPEDLEIDEFDASPESCHHVLVMDGEQPIAAARWRPYGEKTAKLQRVAVLKAWRGQGVGKALILAMEQHARELGYEASVLDGQCQAEPFYRKLGYSVISEEPFYDAGILHVRMKKKL
jgi:predicted GNAT family N-acyltransferase